MRAALFALLLCGCTGDRGGWFAELEATFEARLAGSGEWQPLASGYEVWIERAEVTIPDLELIAAAGAPASEAGGHSHGGEAAEAEPAAAEAALVHLPVGAVDLLAPAARRLACEPGCGLPRAQVSEVHVPVERLLLGGRVRGPRAGEAPFLLDLALPEAALHAAVDLPLDRGHPPRVALAVSLALDAHLLDGVDFASLSGGEPGADVAADLARRLGEIEPAVTITRRD